MIDVRRLLVLRAVAAHGSVTGAARALSYSPSAVSQQLAALERELGVSLADRHGRRIRMTAAGTELAARATALIELADDFELRARSDHQPRPVLRIGAFPRAVDWLLAPVLARHAPQLVDVEVTISVQSPESATRDLRHGLLDLAV